MPGQLLPQRFEALGRAIADEALGLRGQPSQPFAQGFRVVPAFGQPPATCVDAVLALLVDVAQEPVSVDGGPGEPRLPPRLHLGGIGHEKARATPRRQQPGRDEPVVGFHHRGRGDIVNPREGADAGHAAPRPPAPGLDAPRQTLDDLDHQGLRRSRVQLQQWFHGSAPSRVMLQRPLQFFSVAQTVRHTILKLYM